MISGILKLSLVTGLRRAEVAGIRIRELQLEGSSPSVVISRGRAKNANQHRVPLSPQALALVLEAQKRSQGSEFLFPGPTGVAIAPRSVSKAMERTREKLGLADITVHDLRRTVGSLMTRYGVPRDVRERVLNHGGKRKNNVTESVYSWYDFDAEKRAALELQADALDCLVARQPAQIETYASRLAAMNGGGLVNVGQSSQRIASLL